MPFRITGKDRLDFIESLVVGDIKALPAGHARLSLFTNEQGGIKDDTVITNTADYLYVVINAGLDSYYYYCNLSVLL